MRILPIFKNIEYLLKFPAGQTPINSIVAVGFPAGQTPINSIVAVGFPTGQTPINSIVAGGFPAGQTPIDARIQEIKYAVKQGATEIDIVLNRSLVLMRRWKGLRL